MSLSYEEQQEAAAKALSASAKKLEGLVGPWGFAYSAEGAFNSHCGVFASGFFWRGPTRICLCCRAQIDSLYYERTFHEVAGSCRLMERFTIGHRTFMKAIGKHAESRVFETNENPGLVVARDGGSILDAIIFDWSVLASDILRSPSDEFDQIMRRGHRVFDVVPE